jgi:IPT/TIG domain
MIQQLMLIQIPYSKMKKLLYFLMTGMLVFQVSCKKDPEVTPVKLTIYGFTPAGGAANTTLQIFGSGFGATKADNTVKVNGLPAEVLEVTPNKIIAATSAGTSTGKVTVTVNGETVESTEVFTANLIVVKGDIVTSTTWSAAYRYLLIGTVRVTRGSVLTIEPGTVIKGDKATIGTLVIDESSKIIAEGTAEKPIVFTSNQPKGARNYGDWGALVINNDIYSPTNSGTLTYIRIEFSGAYTAIPGMKMGGLVLNGITSETTINHVQVSYSADHAFTWRSGNVNARNVISFRTLDDDFYMAEGDPVNGGAPSFAGNVQFGLALRDPYLADASRANFFEDSCFISSGKSLFSNFTCVGGQTQTRGLGVIDDFPDTKTQGNGRGVHYQGRNAYSIYNSVFAGCWLAGVSLDGGGPSSFFEQGTTSAIEFRNNVFAGTADPLANVRGGVFSLENKTSPYAGFESADGTPQRDYFDKYDNKTAPLNLLLIDLDDDLGLIDLVRYSKLSNPSVLPKQGSPLITPNNVLMIKPAFGNFQDPTNPNSKAGTSLFFDKKVTFVGAFGTEDWTKGWVNWDPQNADY